MAIARIRTPNEPPSAAWNLDGANYVSWMKYPFVDVAEDRDCKDCTTIDRTPADPQVLEWDTLPIWPDDDDPDDADWIPDDQSQTDSEPLEYDSGAESGSDDSSSETTEDPDDAEELYAVSNLCNQPRPERLPHGTWYNNKVFYTGTREAPLLTDFPEQDGRKVPFEHIASPSCQSLRGINGHVLSLEQMKSCRNLRLILPKQANWELGAEDELLEKDSLFFITGETNGSSATQGNSWAGWRSFYPSRHGVQELTTNWESINVGVIDTDVTMPVPVHSYCLDIYAKTSFRRMGRVDLDGLWHWREIEDNPTSYNMDLSEIPTLRSEVTGAREEWYYPWHHFPGDEWLVANPVEIPGIGNAFELCLNLTVGEGSAQAHAKLLNLPPEMMDLILESLRPRELNAVAKTCRAMYHLTQPKFRARVLEKMVWLWEISEGNQYPESPFEPVAWDPICPLGIPPPTLPVGLEDEASETRCWEEIIAEFPEMKEVGEAVRAINTLRRNEIEVPYQEKLAALSRAWHGFRTGVGNWISDSGTSGSKVDWRRTYAIFNPRTTKIPGIRNRKRIWDRCEKILDCVRRVHELGQIENKAGELAAKLAHPHHPGWYTTEAERNWDLGNI
ncbi:hypothetical protein NW768_002350 [Fusarium equiseti]|uniref:F-box domain-containing protein n=1 Tax=Fusarium equiseti TaxID=61235 RepID=A0ABQ8RNF8_FUSEQ|nr:hypothetical protein NW768_002350 [Fusarium equiseti]